MIYDPGLNETGKTRFPDTFLLIVKVYSQKARTSKNVNINLHC